MGGPEYNPADDQEIDREEYDKWEREQRFTSSPPDRPGWWRCKPSVDHAWHVYWFNAYGRGELQVFRYESWPKMTVSDCIRDGWQFAGRVEMPGEERNDHS